MDQINYEIEGMDPVQPFSHQLTPSQPPTINNPYLESNKKNMRSSKGVQISSSKKHFNPVKEEHFSSPERPNREPIWITISQTKQKENIEVISIKSENLEQSQQPDISFKVPSGQKQTYWKRFMDINQCPQVPNQMSNFIDYESNYTILPSDIAQVFYEFDAKIFENTSIIIDQPLVILQIRGNERFSRCFIRFITWDDNEWAAELYPSTTKFEVVEPGVIRIKNVKQYNVRTLHTHPNFMDVLIQWEQHDETAQFLYQISKAFKYQQEKKLNFLQKALVAKSGQMQYSKYFEAMSSQKKPKKNKQQNKSNNKSIKKEKSIMSPSVNQSSDIKNKQSIKSLKQQQTSSKQQNKPSFVNLNKATSSKKTNSNIKKTQSPQQSFKNMKYSPINKTDSYPRRNNGIRKSSNDISSQYLQNKQVIFGSNKSKNEQVSDGNPLYQGDVADNHNRLSLQQSQEQKYQLQKLERQAEQYQRVYGKLINQSQNNNNQRQFHDQYQQQVNQNQWTDQNQDQQDKQIYDTSLNQLSDLCDQLRVIFNDVEVTVMPKEYGIIQQLEEEFDQSEQRNSVNKKRKKKVIEKLQEKQVQEKDNNE